MLSPATFKGNFLTEDHRICSGFGGIIGLTDNETVQVTICWLCLQILKSFVAR